MDVAIVLKINRATARTLIDELIIGAKEILRDSLVKTLKNLQSRFEKKLAHLLFVL